MGVGQQVSGAKQFVSTLTVFNKLGPARRASSNESIISLLKAGAAPGSRIRWAERCAASGGRREWQRAVS